MSKEKGKQKNKNSKKRYVEISKEQQKYFWNIVSNSKNRIVASFLFILSSIALAVILGQFIQGITNLVLSIAVFIVFTMLCFFPLKYVTLNYIQITSETELNRNINRLRYCIHL